MQSLKKISPELARKVSDSPDADVVVIVELHLPEKRSVNLSRKERIEAMKTRFHDDAENVERAIEGAGGEVIDRTWLNHTLKAKLPAATIENLSTIEGIDRIDVPSLLTSD